MFNLASVLIFSSFVVLAIGSNFWNQPVERYETPTCSSKNGTNFCLSCGTVVICLPSGGGYTEIHGVCPIDSPCLDGACTAADLVENCTCATSMDFISYQCDPYNPQYYLLCVNEEPSFLNCPDGQEFDCVDSNVCGVPPTTTTTSTTTTTPPPPCTEVGVFPSGCTDLLVCTVVGQPPAQYSCKNGTFFDPNVDNCVPQEPFICDSTTVTGAYRDPYDCQRYYVCSGPTLVFTGCCADGFYFNNDPDVNSCQPNTNGEECLDNLECSPTASGYQYNIYREFDPWKNYDLRRYFNN